MTVEIAIHSPKKTGVASRHAGFTGNFFCFFEMPRAFFIPVFAPEAAL